jgi:hypothetical protein
MNFINDLPYKTVSNIIMAAENETLQNWAQRGTLSSHNLYIKHT